jgi:hypothetical protein
MQPLSDAICLRDRAKKMRTVESVAADPDEKRNALPI